VEIQYEPGLLSYAGCSGAVIFCDASVTGALRLLLTHSVQLLAGNVAQVSFVAIGDGFAEVTVSATIGLCSSNVSFSITCDSNPGTITIIEPHPPHPKDCKSAQNPQQWLQCKRQDFLTWWRWKHQRN
jgi:hypothetical protein